MRPGLRKEAGFAFCKSTCAVARRGRLLSPATWFACEAGARDRRRRKRHRHHRQEEVYVVLRGVLTLAIEGEERTLAAGETARVAPSVRRQLSNRADELCVVLALGGAGEHEGRDGEAFTSWDEENGRPPQEVPLPADLEL